MESDHRVYCADARSLSQLEKDSVDLVVTSPPYPMIDIWDDLFADLNPAIGDALNAEKGEEAFDLMHDELETVWVELARVLRDGGIACINIGDATRTLGNRFKLYPNHAEIITRFHEHGFQSLPTIHWRKPTNMKTKFMGSGMIPPNAYVTLEHEHILVFRNGRPRSFPAGSDRRYESAYFWEERNQWFTDTWEEVSGEDQSLDADTRSRAGAYPVEIPYRLIQMFSVYGDTVLDPFWGTGTTTVAAMCTARNSIGYELDEELIASFDDRVQDVPAMSRHRARERLAAHAEFAATEDCPYEATHYDTAVKTKQERDICFYHVTDLERTSDGYRVVHAPYMPSDSVSHNT